MEYSGLAGHKQSIILEEIMPNPTSPTALEVDGQSLTLEAVAQVARAGRPVALASTARKSMVDSYQRLHARIKDGARIYGVTTGFGVLADREVRGELALQISNNLLLSHAAALGKPLPRDVVRAAMLIRANSLAKGHSGVRPEVPETLLAMLNHDLVPWIPSQGSLGSSGDLAQLAHLALSLTDVGPRGEDLSVAKIWYQGQLMPAAEALQAAGIERLTLEPKEGLALINGATFTAAMLALACTEARDVLLSSEAAAALSLEALRAVSGAFDMRIHEARPHVGQIAVAARIRQWLAGSQWLDSTSRLQDAYSLRCIPQVLGPAWDALDFASHVALTEINAATDNPLIFGDDVISGGNFHGEPLGQAADFLKIALSEVAAIAERRVYRLLSGHTNDGLPPMLVADPQLAGVRSGLMLLQYTAASLVLENQTLAGPDSARSLPTSAGQEDHNANATTATRHLHQILDNLARVVAIELICAAQAVDLRMPSMKGQELGKGTRAAWDLVRSQVPFAAEEMPFSEHIEQLAAKIRSGQWLQALHHRLG